VEANIATVAQLEREYEESKRPIDRLADRVGSFVGSPAFLAFQLGLIALWIIINTGHARLIRPFDPFPFPLLSLVVSAETVLLSTFVLMEQNGMRRRSEARDHLNLQVDLLAEKEITKVLQILREVAQVLDLQRVVRDAELNEMTEMTSVDTLASRIGAEMPGPGEAD
jgi:uncharacterized membrane protein